VPPSQKNTLVKQLADAAEAIRVALPRYEGSIIAPRSRTPASARPAPAAEAKPPAKDQRPLTVEAPKNP
jgi:hypothetical protein